MAEINHGASFEEKISIKTMMNLIEKKDNVINDKYANVRLIPRIFLMLDIW